jgi:hypothetical protein
MFIISNHIIYFRGYVQDCKSTSIWKMVTSVQSVQNNYNIWHTNSHTKIVTYNLLMVLFETKYSDLNIYVVVHTMYFYDTSW